jgi:hypothetical protein
MDSRQEFSAGAVEAPRSGGDGGAVAQHGTTGSPESAQWLRDGHFPHAGVYFFREEGEVRSETGGGPRIVRVGTHALKDGSGTKLWRRLSQHRGQASGNGNHRGSIFRLIVGAALIRRDTLPFPTWGKGNSAKANIRDGEVPAPRRRAAPCDPPPSLLATLDDYSCNRAHLRAFSEAGPVSLAPRH